MATLPSPAEVNERLQSQHRNIEQTVSVLRRRLRQRMDIRDLLARHWRESLGVALVGGFLVGRLLRRLF